MYLKALEIQGFKSFPDKTVLTFGSDITAIVGPNGSGKSNISDAIRWVMGEQSSRQLRGAKMEDVIFGGTEKRNQMGFAQVTLVMDNTEHIFPRDEAEVAVTRRYYRSGESEYYINKQQVRLKDVNELFMDTGMGREGYSIIGQGKIDEILSVKSGERREIFEEAAGISKFRHRKEESERKLERTQENLVRINDKIAELEMQVEPLRKQAEVAKKYLVLRDELRVLEISVWLEQLQNLKTAKFKLQADVEAARVEKEAAEAALEDTYAAAEALGEDVRKSDMAAEEIRGKIAVLEGSSGEHESAMAVLRTATEHNNENILRVRTEMEESSNRAGGLQEQIDAQLARITAIESESAELQTGLDTLLEQARVLSESTAEGERTAESLRAEEALLRAAAADCKAELSALRSGIHEREERVSRADEELAALREKLTAAETESRANRRALMDATEEAQGVSNIIEGHTLKMEGRKKRAAEAADEKMRLTLEVGNLQNRIRMLAEMEKEYEGFSKAVKLVMQSSESKGLRGIHGPVAGLMTTERKYTVALETALGAGMQNIVVEREEDGKAAINYLKQRDGGRATFLPLSAIRGEMLRENVSGEFGFVGIACDLIRYEQKYDGIFKNLLGRTVVVEDMDCGIAMARKYHSAFRIVTLDGQVMNRGGSMTGGSVSRSAGVLSRRDELEKLRASLKTAEEQCAAASARAEELDREVQKAQYELDVASSQQRKAEDAVLQCKGKQDHYDILIESLRLSIEDEEADIAAFAQRTADDTRRCAQVERSIEEAERKADELHTAIETQRSGQEDARSATDALAEEISTKKAEMSALQAEKEACLRSIADLGQLKRDMLTDGEGRQTLLDRFMAENEKAAVEMEQHTAALAALRLEAQSLREQLNALAADKLRLEGQRDAKTRESRSCNDTVINATQALSRMEQKLQGNAMEEKALLDKLWEHYELSHSAALEQRIELESVPKATRRIAELSREIKSLGTPNIGAIEEYDRVNTRYTYLSEQRGDVEKAREELLGVIDEITRHMTEIFAQQFQLLNESFQETFLELFGGGKAQLELEDENDILGCGIEIKVQPPGKQLKTITLLSGGEKAFVAIALYFAILKVHPTPFCVMDEIEAALDESNVVRFARYMRRVSGKTQFIVITHRRGTMEEADVLYGVTMQERGVSRMLSIDMNDMAKELKIK
ncbi:MAG: chromosome segregation protein SMC [Oscillospiraceae bacterium]|nr:chromosome segregation protein SMC [Oscillospiraceae bacterium]